MTTTHSSLPSRPHEGDEVCTARLLCVDEVHLCLLASTDAPWNDVIVLALIAFAFAGDHWFEPSWTRTWGLKPGLDSARSQHIAVLR